MRPSPCILIPLLALGCGRDNGSNMLDVEYWWDSTRNALLEVEVQVGNNTSAFMVSAEGDNFVGVEQVYDPAGNVALSWEDWYDSTQFLTESVFSWYNTCFLNWPIRDEDGPLTPGTWTVVLSGVDKNGYYQDTDLYVGVHTRRDNNLSQGTVHARLVYASGVRSEDGVEDAVESAVDEWQRIWSSYGLQLEVEYDKSRIDADLPMPGWNSDDLYDIAWQSREDQITLVIGDTVDGDRWTYGMAGGIPGSLAATDRSAISLSWQAHAGNDGVFSADEIVLFGGSMAHEVGHYMGLAHPVEDGYDSWDALSDTPTCSSQTACESSLGENLMYPFSLCDWTTCTTQESLTGGQVAVSQNFTGTL